MSEILDRVAQGTRMSTTVTVRNLWLRIGRQGVIDLEDYEQWKVSADLILRGAQRKSEQSH